MPVIEILEDNIKQQCVSCREIHDISFADIMVGVRHNSQIDEKIMPLPACKQCGAQEFLFCPSDDEPEHSAPGSFGHLHRLLVDILHAKMVERGNVIPDIDPRSILTHKPAAEVINRYLGKSLKIKRISE